MTEVAEDNAGVRASRACCGSGFGESFCYVYEFDRSEQFRREPGAEAGRDEADEGNFEVGDGDDFPAKNFVVNLL